MLRERRRYDEPMMLMMIRERKVDVPQTAFVVAARDGDSRRRRGLEDEMKMMSAATPSVESYEER